MDEISQQRRGFKKNSPFSKEQATFIIMKFSEVKSMKKVHRLFKTRFFPKSPRKVPDIRAFYRVVERFKSEGTSHPQIPAGINPEGNASKMANVEQVKMLFTSNPTSSVMNAAKTLNMSYGTVWRILRKTMQWKPYKPHLTHVLTQAHKDSRLAACEFWLTFDDTWFQRVIWSDEKWFVLRQSPNKQNTRFWAPKNPKNVLECKKAYGEKAMAWVGMVDGRILPVVWFEGSVNSEVYLEQVLKNAVWNAVKGVATRRMYWFQQDGATCHVTDSCLDFLKSKFGNRIISRRTEHHWPPSSPDLSPLDFSFWAQAMQEVYRCRPTTLPALKSVVEDFAANIDPETVRKMARNVQKRASLCRDQSGGHFEHLL